MTFLRNPFVKIFISMTIIIAAFTLDRPWDVIQAAAGGAYLLYGLNLLADRLEERHGRPR